MEKQKTLLFRVYKCNFCPDSFHSKINIKEHIFKEHELKIMTPFIREVKR